MSVKSPNSVMATAFLALLLLCHGTLQADSPDLRPGVSAYTLGASYIGTHTMERISYCLGEAGDVNGDGYGDFIIGTFHHSLAPADWQRRDAGAVYVIFGKSSGFEQNVSLQYADAICVPEHDYWALGYSIGSKGDFNGDGFNDILMGARGNMVAGNPGHVYLVLGRPTSRWSKTVRVELEADASWDGESQGDCTGTSIDFIGDLNGDGCDEILIAANMTGKVYLVKGKSSGLQRGVNLSTADAIFETDFNDNEPGYCVRGIGDINGDGIPDFAIGFMPADYLSGQYLPGRVYIFFGRSQINWGKGFNISYADVIYTEELNKMYGTARNIGALGDVNGDGYSDFMVNCPRYPTLAVGAPAYKRGKVYVIMGRPTAEWTKNYQLGQSQASFIGPVDNDNCGFHGYGMTTGGDVTGDGLSDILIGNIQSDPNSQPQVDPANGPGKVYVIWGMTSGWSNNVGLAGMTDVVSGAYSGNKFGWAVSTIGDINLDGTTDFAVSEPWFSYSDITWRGKVYVFFGKKVKKTIKGTVQYWKNARPIINAAIRIGQDSVTSTKIQGGYFLAFQPGASGIITPTRPSGADLADTTVTSYDAALTARYSIGASSLDEGQRKAADVNANGQINMLDAMLIARYAVGIRSGSTAKPGDWVFDPLNRTFSDLQGDLTGQDFTVMLRGDVDGGWKSPLAKSAESFAGVFERHALWTGDTLEIVLSLNRPVPLISFDVAIETDASELAYAGYEKREAGKGFNVAEGPEAGLIRIGGFQLEDQCPAGELAVVRFVALNREKRPEAIRLRKVQLNQFTVERDELVPCSQAESIRPEDLRHEVQDRVESFGFLGNRPNPFNDRTVVEYGIIENGPVRLEVYDMTGKRVRILVHGVQSRGQYRLSWDGMDDRGIHVPSGVYVIRLDQYNTHLTKKLLLLK